MSLSRVIEVSFNGGSIAYVKADTAYFYNNGIIFKPTDIDLPASYQVHWADSPQSTSTLETIGTAEGAPIPDDLWNRSRVIYGWIYLHPTEDSGITAYEVRIYKNVRAGLPDGTEPTPAEQSTIDQLIGALNSAVEQTEDAEERIENMSVSATTLAEGASATVTKSEQDGVVHLAFGIPKGATGNDGYSPTVSVTKSGKTATITITDKNGTTTAQVSDGTDGTDGEDGVSPTVSVTDITGGHRVVITDKDGAKSFDVADGATGATPNLTIGTVTTLEPDASATASITGTAEDPVLNLGIPRGQTGEVTEEEFTQLKEDLTQSNNEIKRLYVTGKNLIDPIEIALNTILYSDGTTGTANGYNTCDFIPIESGQSIIFSRIRKFMAYDVNKAIVSGSWHDGGQENYTYTATSDGFVRASVANNYLSTWQAEYGSSATPYEPYQRFLAIDLGETPLDQVADLIAETNATYLIEDITPSTGYTDNVFIRWDNGGTSGNSDYRATPQLDMRKYTHVLYTRIQLASASAQSKMGMAFSSTSEYLSGQRRVSGTELKYIPTLIEIPENTSSARFTEHKSLTGFYVKGVRKVDIKDIAEKSNILLGKKWAVCGDSFTNGALTTKIGKGKYSNEKVVYPYLIGNRNEMTIIKFFDGGRTLAFPENPSTFTNSLTNPNAEWYYQNIPSNVDYITIYLGINDEHHAPNSSGGDGEDNTGEIPIGTVNDETTATYLGAWNVVLTWLITNRPNAHIGIIVTNGIASNDAYRQGQIAIAEKYGIPYIDLNGDARTPAMIRTSNPNIPSAVKQALIQKWAVDPSTNTHPNDAAHLFESAFIENFLRSI